MWSTKRITVAAVPPPPPPEAHHRSSNTTNTKANEDDYDHHHHQEEEQKEKKPIDCEESTTLPEEEPEKALDYARAKARDFSRSADLLSELLLFGPRNQPREDLVGSYLSAELEQCREATRRLCERIAHVAEFYRFLKAHRLPLANNTGPGGYFSILPDELSLHIASYLTDVRDVLNLSFVNKKLFHLVADDSLWRRLYLSYYHVKPLPRFPFLAQRDTLEHVAPYSFSSPTSKRCRTSWKNKFARRTKINHNWTQQRYKRGCLAGHSGGIEYLQFDERKIITCSVDETIKIWSLSEMKCLHTIRGHTDCVLCLQFDEHDRLITSSDDHTIKLWNLSVLDDESYYLNNNIRTNGFVGEDSQQRHCNEEEEEERTTEDNQPPSEEGRNTRIAKKRKREGEAREAPLQNGHSGITSTTHTNGQQINVTEEDDISLSYKKAADCLLQTFWGHRDWVRTVQFRENRAISGSGDNTIRVWDVNTGTCQHILTDHQGAVLCVQFDGNELVTCSEDHTIRIWDMRSFKCVSVLKGHTDLVDYIQFDEDKIVSGSADNTLRLWDLRTQELRITMHGHTDDVMCLQFDEKKIVSGSRDQTIRLWDFDGNCITSIQEGVGDGVWCLQFSPEKLIAGFQELCIWDFNV
ncbi:NACHT domain-containing protein [Balamuthia mandrillaris]